MPEAKSAFQQAHAFTAHWEGKISDHPADRGGVTAYGASLAFVRGIAETASGRNLLQGLNISLPITCETIRKLTPEQVRTLFRHEFWDPLKLDELPVRVATLIYDAAVNHGPAQAVRFAQRGHNACTTFGQKLAVDGILGIETRKALRRATPKVLGECLNARRNFYDSIVARDSSQRVFLRGWLNRVHALEKYLEELK